MSIVKSNCSGLKLEVFMLHLYSFNSPGNRTSHLNCFDIVGDERCWRCEDWNVANSGVSSLPVKSIWLIPAVSPGLCRVIIFPITQLQYSRLNRLNLSVVVPQPFCFRSTLGKHSNYLGNTTAANRYVNFNHQHRKRKYEVGRRRLSRLRSGSCQQQKVRWTRLWSWWTANPHHNSYCAYYRVLIVPGR